MEPAKMKPGQRVLVHAGAGGVGSMAVQIAKAWGCWVATTCGPKNLDFVTQELGADLAIDYFKQDFVKVLKDQPVDMVVDMMGGKITAQSKQVLKRRGYLAHIMNPKSPFLSVFIGVALGKVGLGTRMGFTICGPDGASLRKISQLISEGKIKPVVDRVLPLERAAEGQEIVEGGHARGKVILKVQDI